MPISQQRLAYLLEVYSNGRASEDEINELLDWVRASDDPKPVSEHIQQLIERFDPADPVPAADWEALYQRVQQEKQRFPHRDEHHPQGNATNRDERSAQDRDEPRSPVRELPAERLPIRRISWLRAVAATTVFLVGSIFLLYHLNSKQAPPVVAAIPPAKPAAPKPDIQPGADGAILTLANGQRIVLDSMGNGTLATQGNTRLHNEHGQLSYNAANGTATRDAPTNTAEILYNTITTTRGRQYQLRMADGSKVWLNASSSLKFPTAFNSDTRTVEVTGEAYFEIAANPSKPFKVRLPDGEEIQVLGTHFNINAYDDEAYTRTTLVEGSLRVVTPAAGSQTHSSSGQSRILKPGEQAQVARGTDAKIKITDNADIDEIIAWKEGIFLMKKTDVASIMRQIARWYDVEVVYKGNIPSGRISGDIPRNMTLSKVLEVMELSGIHFTVEGKKVIVSP